MHLHYLLEKNSRYLEVSDGVEPLRHKMGNDLLLGIKIPANRKSVIRLVGASEYAHIKAGLDDIGISGLALGQANELIALKTAFSGAGGRVVRKNTINTIAPSPLLVPNPLDLDDPFQPADLLIELTAPACDVFVASSGRAPRDALYRMAKGNGVEIGPGPNPQIKNGPDTTVIYVEEKPADEWLATYKTEATDSAWSADNYKIGKAHDLPVEDHTLDFIFSSHVIEHLYNPLGHFDHWRRKLKPGGLVLGVVPASDGTKDFIQPQTQITELIEEHLSGAFDVPLGRYEKWVGAHNQYDATGDKLALHHFETKFSIHVHVYDYMSINALLRRCVAAHGFADYRIHYKRNSKDFVFALKADAGD